MTNPLSELNIAVIGAGNLGTALIHGLIDSGAKKSSIYIRTSSDERSKIAADKLGVQAGTSNLQIATTADIVILAVKPQKMDKVLAELAPLSTADALFISVAAGISCAQIEKSLPKIPKPRVMRAMPNTPALVKKGATGICKGRHASEKDAQLCRTLFGNLGIVADVDESQINLVTGLSGSGPAYVMRFVEAMVAAGEKLGLDSKTALQLSTQTVHGTMVLLEQSQETPQSLREKVTSPGGTTMAGLAALDARAFDDVIAAAIEAAENRAEELGRKD